MASLKKQARKLARKGRRGDSQLLHISQDELMSLLGSGRVTRNPRTGLPEAFNLGHILSGAFSQAKSMEPKFIQDLPSMPGSPQSLQDAIILNKYNDPFGPDANSMDVFAGGTGHPLGSEHPEARTVGRAVGSYFAGGSLLGALGGESGAATGAGEGAGDSTLFGETPGAGANVGAGAGADIGGSSQLTGFPSDPSVPGDPGDPGFFGGSNPDLSSFSPGGGEGMGMPGETTTTGEMSPGDLGGDPWYKRLGKLGDYLPSLKQAGNAIQIAGGAYGLYNAYQGRQAQKAQQKQQQEYHDKLNALMANPGQVTSLPGYQFNLKQGSEALARRMASMGYGTSGNLALATQQFGSDYSMAALGQQEQLLASLYGKASPPTATMPDPTKLAFQSLSNMGYGFQG